MTPSHTDPESLDFADPAVERAEWRLSVLQEMAEITLDVARALRDRAVAGTAPEPEPDAADGRGRTAVSNGPPFNPAADLARVTRALRLTLTLHARADEALQALLRGEAHRREQQAERARDRRAEAARHAESEAGERRETHKRKVVDLVMDVIEREAETAEAGIDLEEALDERLREDEAYADLEALPLQQVVRRLCEDLQLTPDWRRWTGEGWAPTPFFRPPSSPFHQRSRMPLFGDAGEPWPSGRNPNLGETTLE